MSVLIGRKQVILAVLVVALGAAIYLNYIFSGNNVSGVIDSGAALGGASYVVNQKVSSSASAASGSASTGYFSTARLTRQQTRDKAIDVLKTQASNSSAASADRQSAEAAIENISKNIVTEGQIESTIKAKGFTDCVAFINESGVTVIVKPKTGTTLSDSDTAQIDDVVVKATKTAVSKINIMVAK